MEIDPWPDPDDHFDTTPWDGRDTSPGFFNEHSIWVIHEGSVNHLRFCLVGTTNACQVVPEPGYQQDHGCGGATMKTQRWLVCAVLAGLAALLALHGGDICSTIASDESLAHAFVGSQGQVRRTNADTSIPDTTNPNSSAVLQAKAAMAALFELEDSMGPMPKPPEGWTPSYPKKPTPIAKLPTLKSRTGPVGQLREAIRWFESLEKGQEYSQQQTEYWTARLARAGIQLDARECRQGICRMSITYNRWFGRQPTSDSSRIALESWSFTAIAPDGRPEGHMFYVTSPENR